MVDIILLYKRKKEKVLIMCLCFLCCYQFRKSGLMAAYYFLGKAITAATAI
jgi:hypothetical protein